MVVEKADQFLNLHSEYESKLVVINSYFTNALINLESDSSKEAISNMFRDFYQVIAKFTDELNAEVSMDKKLEIALRRDAFLNNLISTYGIEYNTKEKSEFKK